MEKGLVSPIPSFEWVNSQPHMAWDSTYLHDRGAALGVRDDPDVGRPHFQVVDLLGDLEEPHRHIDAALGRVHHLPLDPRLIGEELAPAELSQPLKN